MTTRPDHSRAFEADRLLQTLERVLAIDELDVRGALNGACTHVGEALGADKVDLFIYEAESEVMVALGTSDTETGHKQHRIGMHHQPLANGGIAVRIFRNGEAYHTGSANNDPEQLRGMVQGLGVRSEIAVPLEVQGERRGVLSAVSLRHEVFTDADLQFLTAVSRWIGLVMHRAELFEQATRDATGRGRREAADELARLTRRQQEIAAAIAEGLSNDEIAERLVLERARWPTTWRPSFPAWICATGPRSASGPPSTACTAQTRGSRWTVSVGGGGDPASGTNRRAVQQVRTPWKSTRARDWK